MSKTRLDLIDPIQHRVAINPCDIQPGERPSEWIARILNERVDD